MKSILDNFAAVLGTSTLALLLMSVSHEYGYFWIVGRSFQTFLSTTDYFSNAILWLPTMVVILYIFVDWEIALGLKVFAPVEMGWTTVFLFSVFIVPSIFAFFFYGPTNIVPYVPMVVFFWLLFGTRFVPFADSPVETLQQARRVLIAAPVVMFTLFSWGLAHGYDDLGTFDQPYVFEMKGGSNVVRIILRNFDKGVLVRDPVEAKIEFIRWDEIGKVRRTAPISSKESLSCLWLKLNCSVAPPRNRP
jgi:hypothetical protein